MAGQTSSASQATTAQARAEANQATALQASTWVPPASVSLDQPSTRAPSRPATKRRTARSIPSVLFLCKELLYIPDSSTSLSKFASKVKASTSRSSSAERKWFRLIKPCRLYFR